MYRTLVLVLLATFLVVIRSEEYEEIDDNFIDEDNGSINMEDIIKRVNLANATWTAGLNFAPDTPLSYYKRIAGGTILEGDHSKDEFDENNSDCEEIEQDLPKNFDARNKWKSCPSIGHIYDQGNCGSCWAVAAASVFTDRVCIHSDGKKTVPLSSQALTSCCHKCAPAEGCWGGWPGAAWMFFRRHGLVTGGDYNSSEGCQPYLLQPCDHHVDGGFRRCDQYPMESTPKCKLHCYNGRYGTVFKKDLNKAGKVYEVLPNEAMKEIYNNGPIQASFEVYEDFFNYKSGVYKHVAGKSVGFHSVRVIGWGEIHVGRRGTTRYWLATNSWNTHWGDKGIFQILRGENECSFESNFVAGIPSY